MATFRDKISMVFGAEDKTGAGLDKVLFRLNNMDGTINLLRRGFTALKQSITAVAQPAAELEANLVSLRTVARTTGRDYISVFSAMESETGGLASRLSLAEGFLKGLTTTLSVDEIKQLTIAIRNASIAMGEDFNVQLPLIIKAIKQLNPAILDNIGVTIRLDQINKKIREGYFGTATAINEATQQHAVFQEIIRQTSQFSEVESAFLETSAGQWQKLKTAISDATAALGEWLLSFKGASDESVFTDIAKQIEEAGKQAAETEGFFASLAKFFEIAFDFTGTNARTGEFVRKQREMREAIFQTNADAHVQAFTAKQLADAIDEINRKLEDNAELNQHAKFIPFQSIDDIEGTDGALQDDELDLRIQRIMERNSERLRISTEQMQASNEEAQRQLDEAMNAQLERINDIAMSMTNIVQSTVTDIVDAWLQGEKNLSDIFERMGRDFVRLFINTAINSMFGGAGLFGAFTNFAGGIFGGGQLITSAPAGITPRGITNSTAAPNVTFVNPIFTRQFSREIQSNLESVGRTRRMRVPSGRISAVVAGPVVI